jgi:hypothetical protein
MSSRGSGSFRNHYGRMTSPQEAIDAIKTEKRAQKFLRECEIGLRRHEFMVERETQNVANYKERIRLLREKFAVGGPNN